MIGGHAHSMPTQGGTTPTGPATVEKEKQVNIVVMGESSMKKQVESGQENLDGQRSTFATIYGGDGAGAVEAHSELK